MPTQEEEDFLKDPSTLSKWAGLPLIERAQLFNLQFPNRKLTYRVLRRLYKEYHIKEKLIKKTKKFQGKDLTKLQDKFLFRR